MRVLLRDINRMLFFVGPDRWSREFQKARCFKHSAEAMDVARANRLKAVEILLVFELPFYCVSLSLPENTLAGDVPGTLDICKQAKLEPTG